MVAPAKFNEEDIDLYVDRIEASGVLGKSKRRLRLLSHLIRAEVLGEGENLKAYSIGLDVFGKGDDFDPSADSIVRVEMGRLRNALTLFEASDYADTAIKVTIPVGTYRPEVTRRETGASGQPPEPLTSSTGASSQLPQKWVVGVALAALVGLAIVFVSLLAPESNRPPIGVQIGEVQGPAQSAASVRSALVQSLSRSQTITVFEQEDGGVHGDANFLLTSRVFETDDGERLFTELRDLGSSSVIWAKSTDIPSGSDAERIVEAELARELRVRLFGASKDFLATLPEAQLSPEALFVLATWVPGPAQSAIAWEKRRIELAGLALERNPEFGAAHSVLADKLAYLANVYGPADTPENREAALFHARQAIGLSPLDPDVVFNVAQAQWHSGLIGESKATMTRVVELDPSHDLARFLSLVIPYTCAAAPDDILNDATRFDEALSPDNPIRWLTLTWLGWLHAYRDEWAQALVAEERAARIFQIPYTFMRRAMVLNQLGRPSEAASVVQNQSDKWDGFDPIHFANVTIPRLCGESDTAPKYTRYYRDLLQALPR
ncbi:MAG: hypothetical protein AAF340_02820 [Pseudomonadota bacterium]